jgi:hypothetical protein
MDVVSFFVSDPEPSLLEQPSEDAFDDTTMPSQSASMTDMPLGYFGDDSPFPQRSSYFRFGIVGAIGIQFVRSAPSSSTRALDGRDGIHQGNGLLGVVFIRSGLDHRERNAFAIADDVPFRAVFPAICGTGSSFRPQKRALTELLSTTALDQSIWSANPNLSRMAFQTFRHTPDTCQSRSRRQQVIPLPQPSSGGRSSYAVPVRAMNSIPVSANRSGTRGRPPFGLGFSGGNRGLIISHNSSVNSGLAILDPPWSRKY